MNLITRLMPVFPRLLVIPFRILRTAPAVFLVSLAFLPLTPQAADPIPGVDVVVEKVPPGNAVFSTTTDRNGFINSRTPLPAANYRVRDKAGHSATIKHKGGTVRWRLTAATRNGKTIWTLSDGSDPL